VWQLTTEFINIWNEINNYYYTRFHSLVWLGIRQGTVSGAFIC
jgi:hypothetical protein